METEIKICKILEVEELENKDKLYKTVAVELCYEEDDVCRIITGNFAGSDIALLGDPKEVEYGICAWSYTSDYYYDVAHTSNLEEARRMLEVLFKDKKYIYEDGILKVLEDYDYKETYEKQVEENIIEKENKNQKLMPNINELMNKIKNNVISQDEAIKKITTAIYTNQKIFTSNTLSDEEKFQSKNNILVIGESGVGKTEIIRQITKSLNVPYIIVTANDFTINGYVGKDVDSIILDLMYKTENNEDLAKTAVVVVDEIDKIGRYDKGVDSIATDGVQKALLKMVEGAEISVTDKITQENFYFDTSKLTFVFLGAFSEIYEKKQSKKKYLGFNSEQTKEISDLLITRDELIKHGFIKEFLGRIPIIVQLNSLQEEDYKKIMANSDLSLLKLKEKYYKSLGVKLSYNDDFITKIAKKVKEENCGARGIKAVLSTIFEELDYEVLQGNLKEIRLEKEKIVRIKNKKENKNKMY